MRTATARGDDRVVLGLLLVPFLLVAFTLTLNQNRRADRGWAHDVAIRTPVPAAPVAVIPPGLPAPVEVAVAPVAVLPPPIAPEIVLPGSLNYPPPQPVIEVAQPFVPPHAIAYPPAVPEITVAALDVRPLPPLPPQTLPVPAPPPVAVAPIPALPTQDQQTCSASSAQLAKFSTIGRLARAPRLPRLAGVDPDTFGKHLAAAAVEQTRDLVIYTARYQPMAYPMGDVVSLHGACIDVVIRAYRAVGIDLQEEVQRARPSRGDPNIDHRRTENLRRFLDRFGTSLPITEFPEDYKPGDIVTYHRPFSRVSTSHIAIVSDVMAPTGRLMIVHNRGYGAQLEDALFVDRITGHYRYMGGPLSAPASQPVHKTGPKSGSSASLDGRAVRSPDHSITR